MLCEYGFCLENNKYDFCRISVNLENYLTGERLDFAKKQFKLFNLKSKIIVDLKFSSLNYDLLLFLRIIHWNEGENIDFAKNGPISKENEILVLKNTVKICENELKKYATTFEQDNKLLENIKDYKMRYILYYRIGKKRILLKQIEICKEILETLLGKIGKFTNKYENIPTMKNYIENLKKII